MFQLLFAGLVVATTFNIPYSDMLISVAIFVFSSMYYTTSFLFSMGILKGDPLYTDKAELINRTSKILAYTIATLVTFYTPYFMASLYALPWLLIINSLVVASWLLYYGIIELSVIEDEEENK